MAASQNDLDNSNTQQCECSGCNIDSIKNLDEDFRMTSCPMVTNGCKAIRKLLKKGFMMLPNTTGRKQSIHEGEYFDEFISRRDLIKALTHTLVLWHPNKINYIKFILARYRTCVSIHDLYRSCGFYVADNHSMAFLRFKNNKKLSCYFIDMKSSEIRYSDLAIDITDKEMCSFYLFDGSLWIVQNGEIGVINMAHIRLKDNPVQSFVRAFGTMDYWNPNSTRKVIFTNNELHHEFLHVTLDTKKTKIIRKHVSTMKNAFFIPVNNRQVIIYYDFPTQKIIFEFSIKEEKLKIIRSLTMDARFEQRNYSMASSNVTNLVVVRINKNTVVLLDTINCCVLKTIPLNNEYDLNKKVQFMFSPNGKRLLVLGTGKNASNESFWTQHLTCGIKTLKSSALRAAREHFTVDELRNVNLPKTLSNELNFGRL